MVDVNGMHVGMVASHYAASMAKRGSSGKRSAVITVSSVAGNAPISRTLVYCATKIFVKYLTMAMDWEGKRDGTLVDAMCLQPSYVKTNLVDKFKGKITTPGIVSTTECVNGALRDLGKESVTYGPLVHEITGALMAFAGRYKQSMSF